MKIAIFSDCYLDLTGGIVTNINAEKAALESRGYTVYVFSSAYPRSRKAKTALSAQNIFPVKSCRLFFRGLTPIARRPRIIERELMKTHPELRDFDIFYVHYEAGCSIAGLRLAKHLKIPSVQVMHGREDIGEQNLIPRGFRTVVATLLDWFHSWYLPHPVKIRRDDYLVPTIASAKMWSLMVNHANAADLVITPSDHFREKLAYYGVKRDIIALHHGIDDALIAEQISPRKFNDGDTLRIIWHSRITEEKRILPFLKALYQVKSPYHLDVYGSGVEEPLAITYAKSHRMNVAFHGEASFAEIWQAIKNAHLDVLVSYNYDTFGMTLIEAEAAGTPVFIVDPDMKEIVPKGGFLLADGPDVMNMANALNGVFAHPDSICKMSQIMLKNRHQIKLSHKIDELEKLFYKLAKKH